jgi:hypothetical protein
MPSPASLTISSISFLAYFAAIIFTNIALSFGSGLQRHKIPVMHSFLFYYIQLPSFFPLQQDYRKKDSISACVKHIDSPILSGVG